MSERDLPVSQFSLRTVWTQNLETPLRRFLRTETAGAAVLLAARVAALAWANVDSSRYAAVWRTEVAVRVGTAGLADSVHGWVNSGLMAFSSWRPASRHAGSSTWVSCVSGGGWRCRRWRAWAG